MSEPSPFGQEPTGPPEPLPPLGSERDPDPTRVMPAGPPPGDAAPTTAMPSTGGPYDPGPPFGPGGGGGGEEPPFDEPAEDPWYRQPGPLAALIAGLAALIVALIALLVWASDDDDDTIEPTLPSIESTTSTTVLESTTTGSAPPTEPATTTSSSTTTTSTTSTTSTTLPPTTEAPTTTAAPTTAATTTTTTIVPVPPPNATAWSIVESATSLDTLEALFACTGVDATASSAGPVTVFAPTNAAFDGLFLDIGVGAVDELCADTSLATSVANAQIARAEIASSALVAGFEVATDAGDIPVNNDGTIGSRDATVVQRDLAATNGLVQVVDEVLASR